MLKIEARCIKYGDDISTDLIIPGKCTKTLDVMELASHAMEDLDEDFHKKAENGAFVVGGKYFGCGSSREQAPTALKYSNVKAIVAKSFARIFYRNAINLGIPIIECDTDEINDGDILSFEVGGDKLIDVTTGKSFDVKPLPSIMVDILAAGGIVPYYKNTK